MLCALVVTIGGALTPMDARSEYPDKPIKLVVSFPPGSGTDSNARYLARKMEERLESRSSSRTARVATASSPRKP
jgi:tripartite-type tricarboxylate transporter receptor subunit TctC